MVPYGVDVLGSLNKHRQYLKQKCSCSEQGQPHRISLYEELKKLGMGIKEL
jgi:hypothetical protein